jgi:hypothetical protein
LGLLVRPWWSGVVAQRRGGSETDASSTSSRWRFDNCSGLGLPGCPSLLALLRLRALVARDGFNRDSTLGLGFRICKG